MEEQRSGRIHIKYHFKKQEKPKYHFTPAEWKVLLYLLPSTIFASHPYSLLPLCINFSSARIRKLGRDLWKSSDPAHKSLSPPSSKLIWHIAIPKNYSEKTQKCFLSS